MEQQAQSRDGKHFFLDQENHDSVVYCLILFSNTTNYIAGMSWKVILDMSSKAVKSFSCLLSLFRVISICRLIIFRLIQSCSW